MILARVIGRVISTRKDAGLTGLKLLLIQPVDDEGKSTRPPLVATDSIGAGAGETVFYCTGREAAIPFTGRHVATDACIVGIVDSIYSARK